MKRAGNKTSKQRTQVQLVRKDSHLPNVSSEPIESYTIMIRKRMHMIARTPANALGDSRALAPVTSPTW
jgi:hypothetical protein